MQAVKYQTLNIEIRQHRVEELSPSRLCFSSSGSWPICPIRKPCPTRRSPLSTYCRPPQVSLRENNPEKNEHVSVWFLDFKHSFTHPFFSSLFRPVHAHPRRHISQQQQWPFHLIQTVSCGSEVRVWAGHSLTTDTHETDDTLMISHLFLVLCASGWIKTTAINCGLQSSSQQMH